MSASTLERVIARVLEIGSQSFSAVAISQCHDESVVVASGW
jgi:hypothetical protein